MHEQAAIVPRVQLAAHYEQARLAEKDDGSDDRATDLSGKEQVRTAVRPQVTGVTFRSTRRSDKIPIT
jgi:hypothetical protein